MILESLMTGVALATSGVPGPADDYWYPSSLFTYPMSRDQPSADSSMQTAAVLACVRILSETLASLPFHVYRSGEPAWPGAERMATRKALDHPLNTVLRRPNKWQTGMEFIEMMQGHLVLRGNGYAAIVPGDLGSVTELIPKHPDRMDVFRLDNGRLGYLYKPLDGPQERYTQDEMFHLRGFSIDGVVGISPIAACRHAIALAQQMEDHSVSFYANMAKPGGILEMPENKTLPPERHAQLKKSWNETASGNDLYKVQILEDGMTWRSVGLSAEDSQLLDSRRFQIVDIARLFRVSPHKIYAAIEHGHTYANIEQSDLSFVKDTMLPWIVRWEQTIGRDLIADQDQFFPKFAVEGLLRADTEARREFYRAMVELAVFCPNDVLELEDRNPREDGEMYYRASNLVPADSPAATVLPTAPDQKEEEEQGDAETDAVGYATWALNIPAADIPQVPAAPTHAAPPEHPSPGHPAGGGRHAEDPGGRGGLGALRGWVADAASRVARAEIRELAKRVDKADEDRDRFNAWVNGYWGGRHADYIEAAVAPILRAAATGVTPEAVAATVAKQAIGILSTGDPLAVLEKWKEQRAGQLAELLMEAIDDGRAN